MSSSAWKNYGANRGVNIGVGVFCFLVCSAYAIARISTTLVAFVPLSFCYISLHSGRALDCCDFSFSTACHEGKFK